MILKRTRWRTREERWCGRIWRFGSRLLGTATANHRHRAEDPQPRPRPPIRHRIKSRFFLPLLHTLLLPHLCLCSLLRPPPSLGYIDFSVLVVIVLFSFRGISVGALYLQKRETASTASLWSLINGPACIVRSARAALAPPPPPRIRKLQ